MYYRNTLRKVQLLLNYINVGRTRSYRGTK